MSNESEQGTSKVSLEKPPSDPPQPRQPPKVAKWVVFFLLFSVGIFMYASIMYKVAHYGP